MEFAMAKILIFCKQFMLIANKISTIKHLCFKQPCLIIVFNSSILIVWIKNHVNPVNPV